MHIMARSSRRHQRTAQKMGWSRLSGNAGEGTSDFDLLQNFARSRPIWSVDRTWNLDADGGGPEVGEVVPWRNNEQDRTRAYIILTTLVWNTHNDMDRIDIKLRGERVQQ